MIINFNRKFKDQFKITKIVLYGIILNYLVLFEKGSNFYSSNEKSDRNQKRISK